MLALGCILIGLGLGLILENLQEAIEFSLVGLIVGSFLYTKLGIYIKLNANKTKKTINPLIDETSSVINGST